MYGVLARLVIMWVAILLTFLGFTSVVFAGPPKAEYSTEERAQILTAATVIGALGYCDDHEIMKTKVPQRLYYKLAEHMKPHFTAQTDEGEVSRAGPFLINAARSTGRFAVFTLDPEKNRMVPTQLAEMRSVEACKMAEAVALKLMAPGALFDNDAKIPGESDL